MRILTRGKRERFTHLCPCHAGGIIDSQRNRQGTVGDRPRGETEPQSFPVRLRPQNATGHTRLAGTAPKGGMQRHRRTPLPSRRMVNGVTMCKSQSNSSPQRPAGLILRW